MSICRALARNFIIETGLIEKFYLQNLNILTVGAKDGKGGFFPEGIAGRINTPEGFDALSEGIEDFNGQAQIIQVCIQQAIVAVMQEPSFDYIAAYHCRASSKIPCQPNVVKPYLMQSGQALMQSYVLAV